MYITGVVIGLMIGSFVGAWLGCYLTVRWFGFSNKDFWTKTIEELKDDLRTDKAKA